MKELLYYFAEDGSWMYGWQRYQIFPDLESLGYRVTVFNPLNYQDVDTANEELARYIRAHSIDVFMTPHSSRMLRRDVLDILNDKGIPTILYLCDSRMTQIEYEECLPWYDLVLMSDKDQGDFYTKRSKDVLYFPYAAGSALVAAGSALLNQADSDSEQNAACFLGTLNGSRIHYINKIIDSGSQLDLYINKPSDGSIRATQSSLLTLDHIKTASSLIRSEPGRKLIAGAFMKALRHESTLREAENVNIFDSVGNDAMAEKYASYALSLSFSAVRSTAYLRKPIRILHLRNFEIPASGGLQLSVYFEELAECFEDGKEIIMFHDEDEMSDLVRYWTNPRRSEKRLNMKKAACQRVLREHTWRIRFEGAFRHLGIF